VISVHDGDTITLDVDCGFDWHMVHMDVRLGGVDAPELHRPDHLGEDARGFLLTWLAAHPGPYVITTEQDHTEKYGRYLVSALTAVDHHELIGDGLVAGWLKMYAGRGPKPSWP
jgi:endonuclease YncB( thermonuclease family)